MSISRAGSLRFTGVSLQNWRNFKKVDIDLARRVILVGPNASGKSNFLDVFRYLQAIVSVGGGFQEATQERGGVSLIRCLAARRFPEIVIRATVGNDEELSIWTYELRFKQDNRQRPILTKEKIEHRGVTFLDRPDADDGKDSERLSQTYLEQVNANKNFRDLAEFFKSIQYLHIVPQLIREPDRSLGKKNDPFGGDFLEQIGRTPEKTREAWLPRIRDALKLAVPQMQDLEMVRDPRGIPHLKARYAHWRPNGAWQSESQFSDGTLRLMGLLWALLRKSGPILLEEPELSLHPGVVSHLPQMFARMQRRSGRQILISTHSSDLLKDEGIGLDEVLLLEPGDEGTTIRLAAAIEDVKALLDGGLSLSEIVIPKTRPERVEQLTFFLD